MKCALAEGTDTKTDRLTRGATSRMEWPLPTFLYPATEPHE